MLDDRGDDHNESSSEILEQGRLANQTKYRNL